MKVVILAGGLGTRLSEETVLKPKPMVEVGEYPIIWHIMKHYARYGFNEFVICGGYKCEAIYDYFTNYHKVNSDLTVSLKSDAVEVHENRSEDWKVTIVNTGLHTMTGGRIKRIEKYLDGPFLLTYGDGVSDVNINEVIDLHKKNKNLITLTAVQPPHRFGVLDIDSNGKINKFTEKPVDSGQWINGGFFVCEKEIIKYIADDTTVFESAPLEALAATGRFGAYRHHGFWHAMDTLRDKTYLEKMWKENKAPWKTW